MSNLSEEEKKAIEKLSSKKNETTWYDTIRQIKKEEITDVVVTRQKYITIILNLIEKQNKIIETNKENWLLAQNEVLGYAQGYEDGKQHKQTVTAMVVENRKYQIIGEEIKRYKAIIEKQQKEIEQEKEKNKKLQDKCIELEEENIKIKHLMRNPCDIPRQIIIEKMNKDINTNEHTILVGRRYGKTLEYGIRLGRIQMCEELLQEGDK